MSAKIKLKVPTGATTELVEVELDEGLIRQALISLLALKLGLTEEEAIDLITDEAGNIYIMNSAEERLERQVGEGDEALAALVDAMNVLDGGSLQKL